MLIKTKNLDKNKEIVAEIKDRISDLKQRLKEMSETEKKNADETLQIIKKILNYSKNVQKIFQFASKFDKGKSGPKPGESIADRVKLKKGRIAEIKKEKNNINKELFKK